MKRNARRAAAILMIAAAAAVPALAAAPAVQEAQTLMGQGDYKAALDRLDRYLASSPQDAEARFSRGLVLVKLNRSEDAIKAFAELTRDYPQLPEPYNNLAVLYAQKGDYEKARDALEAALATHPAYATAHENLGDIYAALAGSAYNRALQLDQGNQAVRYKLSLINQLGNGPGGNFAGGAAAANSVPAGNPKSETLGPTQPLAAGAPVPAAAPAAPAA
ncbi:MAG: tetratricopeptide repeat protein, partial [Nevskia sp.]|nr:tetratricopeptide repeat protein [Nevskia sp.]